MSNSIVSNNRSCYICGSTEGLHRHHVFYGHPNRSKSEEDGCWVYLCSYHHNGSSNGVHFNKNIDDMLKQQTEKLWIKEYTDENESMDDRIEKFINRFGKNYL